jgi:hypothetical protein
MDKQQSEINFYFKPTVEIIPPRINIIPGGKNRGLKMISMNIKSKELRAKFEGISGENYTLTVLNPEFILDIEGATLKDDQLLIQIPEGEHGTFLEHKIRLQTK